MAIIVQWYNLEKTILLVHVQDAWTWDDYHAAAAEVKDALLSQSRQVDMIIYFSSDATRPDIHAFAYLRQSLAKYPLNLNSITIAAEDYFIQTFFGAARQVFGRLARNLYITDNLDSAIQHVSCCTC